MGMKTTTKTLPLYTIRSRAAYIAPGGMVAVLATDDGQWEVWERQASGYYAGSGAIPYRWAAEKCANMRAAE